MIPVTDEGVAGKFPSMDYGEEDVNPAFAEKDFVDHRQVYIGLHHRPAEKHNRRGPKLPKFNLQRPPKTFRWENGKKVENHSEDSASEGEAEVDALPAPASERVKFILGGEEEEIIQENPHLFTELEELFVYLDGNVEWKETARWYKYEEDVEEGGDRWSKPHVATLSLYSLLELRSSLMAGTVMLDMDATTLSGIADLVIDNLVSCNKLEEIFRAKVRDTLLRKHRHQRSTGFRRNLSNIMSSRKSFNHIHHSNSQKSNRNSANSLNQNGHVTDDNQTTAKTTNDTDAVSDSKIKLFRNFSQPAFPTIKQTDALNPPKLEAQTSLPTGHLVYPTANHSGEEDNNDKAPGFMKKLPPNSEASNILVGEVDFLEKPITAFVRLATSTIIGDLTEVPIPTRFLFIMLGPGLSPGRYHEIGRAISTLMADDVFHDVAYKAKSREDLIAGIDEFLEQVTVLPPGEWDPSIRIPPTNGCAKNSRRQTVDPKNGETVVDHSGKEASDSGESTENYNSNPLLREKKCFGGLLNDLITWKKRTRDIRDGLNVKCFGVVFFMYFSILALLTSIGQHQKEATGGFLGMREQLLSLVITGIPFALFSGQPLLIISYSVPISIFEVYLYKISQDLSFDYLPLRLWVGLWTMFQLTVFVMLDVSRYVHYLTRFTSDIFKVLSPCVLIGYGFISFIKMLSKYSEALASHSNVTCACINKTTLNNTIMIEVLQIESYRDCNGYSMVDECTRETVPMTFLLVISTILLIAFFSSFQHFGYLPSKIHHFFHNFATLIGVLLMSIIVTQFNAPVRYVTVPKDFKPDLLRSSWSVEALGSNEAWVVVVAFIPAIFLTLLITVEQQVTAFCVNRKENLLTKGHGYHLDLLVILIGVGVAALLGLPFCVASVVLSINHLSSLKDNTEIDDFIGGFRNVMEQRITGLLVYVLVALTPTMRPALRYIPVPVLYGVLILVLCKTFINVQFVTRFTLLFIPEDKRPDMMNLRQVPLISVNILTIVQLFCLIACWVVRATPGALVFPFMILVLVFVRSLVERVLPLRDIHILDEPMPKITFRVTKAQSSSQLITDVETGVLLQDESNEDVLHDHNNTIERVNLSEELSKTAAWKQLTYAENSNSPLSNSPKDDAVDGNKKRRKKRTRESIRSKDGNASPSTHQKNSTFKKTELFELREGLLEHEYNSEKLKRTNKDRGSLKRQASQERKSVKRQSSHDRKHKQSKPKPPEEETPPPPWALPYASPPRKDFGLLKIPEDDLSVDPACTRNESIKSGSIEPHSAVVTPADSNTHSAASSIDGDDRENLSPEESRDASSEQD